MAQPKRPMAPEEAEPATDEYSAYVAMRQKAKYLQRGRYLAGVSTPELKSKWLAMFRQWAKNLKAPQDHQARQDIEAELDLRGEELPTDAYREFSAAVKRALAEPMTAAEQQRADAEYAEFLRSFENPN